MLWDQSNWDTRPAGNSNEGSTNLSNACSQISGNTKVHTANDVHFDYPVHQTVPIYETFGNVRPRPGRIWIHLKNSVPPTTSSDSLSSRASVVNITAVTETTRPRPVRQSVGHRLDIEPGR